VDLERTERFLQSYRRLTAQERRQVENHLRLLGDNPRHPSLRARKWPGSDIWYARLSRNLRLFFEIHEDHYLLLDVGHHDIERSR
jgi:mRNA-degrading endonuclease RelE of RelBE toxin-antitoxin system